MAVSAGRLVVGILEQEPGGRVLPSGEFLGFAEALVLGRMAIRTDGRGRQAHGQGGDEALIVGILVAFGAGACGRSREARTRAQDRVGALGRVAVVATELSVAPGQRRVVLEVLEGVEVALVMTARTITQKRLIVRVLMAARAVLIEPQVALTPFRKHRLPGVGVAVLAVESHVRAVEGPPQDSVIELVQVGYARRREGACVGEGEVGPVVVAVTECTGQRLFQGAVQAAARSDVLAHLDVTFDAGVREFLVAFPVTGRAILGQPIDSLMHFGELAWGVTPRRAAHDDQYGSRR